MFDATSDTIHVRAYQDRKLDVEHIGLHSTVHFAHAYTHATTSCVRIQFGIELHGRMITDVNNSVIMTSTVAGYANKARQREIKGVEPMEEGEEERRRGRCRPMHRRS